MNRIISTRWQPNFFLCIHLSTFSTELIYSKYAQIKSKKNKITDSVVLKFDHRLSSTFLIENMTILFEQPSYKAGKSHSSFS